MLVQPPSTEMRTFLLPLCDGERKRGAEVWDGLSFDFLSLGGIERWFSRIAEVAGFGLTQVPADVFLE